MVRSLLTLFVVLGTLAPCRAQQTGSDTWTFAVSGDSRDCGDVVMPAIARSALQDGARFYWHLGDFRLMAGVDADVRKQYGSALGVGEYRQLAWGDFLANQVARFSPLPVYLGIGNHELAGGKTKKDFLDQFAYWVDRPEVRAQRLAECSGDCAAQTYYRWKAGPVDFIYLDNSSDEGFDEAQLKWFERVLAADKSGQETRTLVVGMHRALPNSLACAHSMNGDRGTPAAAAESSTGSGRRAYRDLADWKTVTGKNVYVLASHSHFFMQDIFATGYWKDPRNGGTVLPGWIVGTAGARRYRLPELTREQQNDTKARTRIYGYLRGTVHADGKIDFDFREVQFPGPDFPADVEKRFGTEFVRECFVSNYDDSRRPVPDSCKAE
jgi:hypothetical protein